MKRFLIKAYPYATQFGSIDVPDEIADNMDAVFYYINDHFDEVSFSKPILNYSGTDFEFEENDE